MSRVQVSIESGVAVVTLVRPDQRNALNMELKTQLAEVLARVTEDPRARAVLLTGAGPVFCAGGDINEMYLNDSPERSRSRLEGLLRTVVEPLMNLRKPTIAALNGDAHGAGLSLALACDLIVASEGAVLSCAFGRMGLVPDCGASHLLPRRVGLAVAKDLVFSGRRVAAEAALDLGLVDQVVPLSDLERVARERAEDYARSAPVALGLAKLMLNQSLETSWSQMAQVEAMSQAICYETDDHREARRAFAAREQPRFVGR